MIKRRAKVRDEFKALRASEGNDCCEVCRWRPPLALRDVAGGRIDKLLPAHHILPVACGGVDGGENLILLCPTCHAIAHHIGEIYRLEKGGQAMWSGPATRRDFLFAMVMLKNRAEYPRFAALAHRRDAYLALLHEEAIQQDAVEEIRIYRRFTVLRGRKGSA